MAKKKETRGRKKASGNKAGKIATKAKEKKMENVIEQRLEHFSSEMENIGNRIGKRGKEAEGWFHRTFGIVSPFISSLFGIVVFGLAIWAISFVNIPVGSAFLSDIYSFLLDNIALFFLIFLFFSYSSYFSKKYPRSYMPVSPVFAGIGIVVGFWMAAKALIIANMSLGLSMLSMVASFIESNLFWIFLAFTLFGYVVLLVKTEMERPHSHDIYSPHARRHRTVNSAAKTSRAARKEMTDRSGIRRLYRSGDDRILGGVCGGIAEYLGVDPVLIRLLWVIGTLAWGTGIIAYIIAWIIIPRNPRNKWN